MVIFRIAFAAFAVILCCIAINEYFKMRRLLKEHGDKKLEDVFPELQAQIKKFEIIAIIFAVSLIVKLILDIVFE